MYVQYPVVVDFISVWRPTNRSHAAALPVVRQNGPVSDIGLHYGDLGLPVDNRRECQGMAIGGKTRRHCDVGSA